MSALLLSLALQASPMLSPRAEARSVPDEIAVLAKIERVFAALEAGDGPALLEQVDAEGRIGLASEKWRGTHPIAAALSV